MFDFGSLIFDLAHDCEILNTQYTILNTQYAALTIPSGLLPYQYQSILQVGNYFYSSNLFFPK